MGRCNPRYEDGTRRDNPSTPPRKRWSLRSPAPTIQPWPLLSGLQANTSQSCLCDHKRAQASPREKRSEQPGSLLPMFFTIFFI